MADPPENTAAAVPDALPDHPYLSRLSKTQDLLLCDLYDDTVWRFSVSQARLFCAFDEKLRKGQFDPANDAIPGGYELFATVWNYAEEFPYLFCTLEGENTIEVHGLPPSADSLAPLPAAPSTAPRYSKSQEKTVQDLLWDVARRDAQKRQRIEESRAQREKKRSRLQSEKANAVYGAGLAKPNKTIDGEELARPNRAAIRHRTKGPRASTGPNPSRAVSEGPVAGPSGEPRENQPEVKSDESGAKGKEAAKEVEEPEEADKDAEGEDDIAMED
ncbi:hypothetical protein C8Q79DRAFT_929268 [Trametes meyenii]|nr:hypothetical protein C8Q79DRAFT_929268 [Trametes meyenii]